jgi:IS5 family transposase
MRKREWPLCARLRRTQSNSARATSALLYSIHAPEVECIAKGKAHKKYEFGCKTAIATTSKNNWILAIDAHHDNPYDGATLKSTIDQIERVTGVRPKQAFVDRGYRGKEHHPADLKVQIAGQHKATGVRRLQLLLLPLEAVSYGSPKL